MSALIFAALAMGSAIPTPVQNTISGGFDPIIGLPTGTTLVEAWPTIYPQPIRVNLTPEELIVGIGSQGNWTEPSPQSYRIWIWKISSKSTGMTPETVPFESDERVYPMSQTPPAYGLSEYFYTREVAHNSTYTVNYPVVRGRNIHFKFENLSGEPVWLRVKRMTSDLESSKPWDVFLRVP